MNSIQIRVVQGYAVIFIIMLAVLSSVTLRAQDTSRHAAAALELVKVSGVKEELRGGIKMVRGYGKLPPNDTTVQKFDRSYDALFADGSVYRDLAAAYVSAYDEKTIEAALEWMQSDAYRVMNEKDDQVQGLMSAPADHMGPASEVDTAVSRYKTALEVARKELLAQNSAMGGMPGGAEAKTADGADAGKEKKLARVYAGMFDEPTLKAKLAWVGSEAHAVYMKKLPSVQMKCVMTLISRMK